MDGGSVADIGAHEELLARNPIYQEGVLLSKQDYYDGEVKVNGSKNN